MPAYNAARTLQNSWQQIPKPWVDQVILVLRRRFAELHTGYRAYGKQLLKTIPFLRNSNDFVFDTEVIAQAVSFGFRIAEVPVSTRYFAEASSANLRQSLVYGVKTLMTMATLLSHRVGLVRSRLFVR